jgi:hypothetical protein
MRIVSVNKFERLKMIAAAEEKRQSRMAHTKFAAVVAAKRRQTFLSFSHS